jgi:predicted DCC family thiol-disulfide oxidoreductase YuxK
MERLHRPVMLYDGNCRLCRSAARVVAALDRDDAVALVRLADAEAGTLLSSIPEAARDDRWWLVPRDGTPMPGDGGAGLLLLRELRLTRRLGSVLEVFRASRLLDALDMRISRHRSRLGRFVPDGQAPRRFP